MIGRRLLIVDPASPMVTMLPELYPKLDRLLGEAQNKIFRVRRGHCRE